MIKQLAWNTFKNTGNINTFLEFLEVENMEKNLLNNNFPNDTKNFIRTDNINNSNKNWQ